MIDLTHQLPGGKPEGEPLTNDAPLERRAAPILTPHHLEALEKYRKTRRIIATFLSELDQVGIWATEGLIEPDEGYQWLGWWGVFEDFKYPGGFHFLETLADARRSTRAGS
jgi:hypothetical protein